VKTEEERYLRSVRKPGVRLAPAAAAAQWEAPGGGIVAESESLATAQTVSMGFQGLGSCLIFLFWLLYKIFFLQTYYRKLFSYLNLSTVRPLHSRAQRSWRTRDQAGPRIAPRRHSPCNTVGCQPLLTPLSIYQFGRCYFFFLLLFFFPTSSLSLPCAATDDLEVRSLL
jgi:hypothetical protein